jgi:hypothetical protein
VWKRAALCVHTGTARIPRAGPLARCSPASSGPAPLACEPRWGACAGQCPLGAPEPARAARPAPSAAPHSVAARAVARHAGCCAAAVPPDCQRAPPGEKRRLAQRGVARFKQPGSFTSGRGLTSVLPACALRVRVRMAVAASGRSFDEVARSSEAKSKVPINDLAHRCRDKAAQRTQAVCVCICVCL